MGHSLREAGALIYPTGRALYKKRPLIVRARYISCIVNGDCFCDTVVISPQLHAQAASTWTYPYFLIVLHEQQGFLVQANGCLMVLSGEEEQGGLAANAREKEVAHGKQYFLEICGVTRTQVT